MISICYKIRKCFLLSTATHRKHFRIFYVSHSSCYIHLSTIHFSYNAIKKPEIIHLRSHCKIQNICILRPFAWETQYHGYDILHLRPSVTDPYPVFNCFIDLLQSFSRVFHSLSYKNQKTLIFLFLWTSCVFHLSVKIQYLTYMIFFFLSILFSVS